MLSEMPSRVWEARRAGATRNDGVREAASACGEHGRVHAAFADPPQLATRQALTFAEFVEALIACAKAKFNGARTDTHETQ